jgi:glycine oxidase
VIGAGIVGCAVARELARRGLEVRVLEARTTAAGATQASAGMLAPFIEGHAGTGFLDLAVRSLALYDEFVDGVQRDSGRSVEYRRQGSLQVALDDQSAGALRTACESGGAAVWMSAREVAAVEPWLTPRASGAAFVATHGYVGVEPLTLALAEAAARCGAVIETGVAVSALTPAANGLVVRAHDGREWAAATAVLAAGSWSGSLCPEEPLVRAVRPVRGQLLRLRVDAMPIAHVVWGPDCYVVPWSDGTVLVGATEEEAGFDQRATADGVRLLLEAACRLFPPAAAATFVGARAGLRPASPDGLPIIGASARVPGLVHATGHFRNGVLLAPLTAAIVADLVVERREDPALALTRPDRAAAPATAPR